MALPGPFLAGQRLTAGQLNDATQKTITSQEIGIAGSVATTSGTTQLNVSQLALTPVDLVNGALYSWGVRLILTNTVATDEFSFKIRRDTPLTGTIISEWIIYRPNQNAGGYFFVNWDDWAASADETAVQFYCSVQRVTGTGTMSVFGQLGATNRTGVALRRVGYASELVVVT